MKLIAASALSLFVLLTAAVQAQDVPQASVPEKEHQWLQQFAGEWITKSKGDMGPGQPPLECDGTISSRMIGGLWVTNELKGDIAGTQMHGIQTVGYDPVKKKYVGTWIDSMVNHMWRYEGTVDAAGKTLTLEAEGPDFMVKGKVAMFQDIYEFKSADEIAIYSKMQGEDGKWITFMTGTAKRVKTAK